MTLIPSIRICNRCNIEKNIYNFYMYSHFTYKHICKQCEQNSSYRKQLWYCDDCGFYIRQVNKSNHIVSHRHLINRFHNMKYDYSRLQPQNKRRA